MQTIDRFDDSDSITSTSPDRVWTPVGHRSTNSDRPSRVSTTASSSFMANDVQPHHHDAASAISCPLGGSSLGDSDIDNLDLSDSLPTAEELREAGNIPIYDADGQSIPFRSLYQGPEHQGQRQLLVFIRHFYCGGCQTYVRALTETISPAVYFSLPIPTTITIIGCGEPHIIPHHAIKSHCPFRYYAEPTRKLYKIFNMPKSRNPGPKPQYADYHMPTMLFRSVSQMMKGAKREKSFHFKGGDPYQIGGEFLFEDGAPIWVHRMKDMRSHTEMDMLRRVLGAQEGEEDDPHKWIPGSQRSSTKSTRQSTSIENSKQATGIKLIQNPRPSTTTNRSTSSTHASQAVVTRTRFTREDGRTPNRFGRGG